MYDFISASELDFSFIQTSESSWNVTWTDKSVMDGICGEVKLVDGKPSAVYHNSQSQYDADAYSKSILNDFYAYRNNCVDFILDNPIDNKAVLSAPISEESAGVLKQMYQKLISVIYYNYCTKEETNDETKARAKALTKRCLDWLDSTDFFIAPGSTVYHDAEPCGLLRHSLRVVNKMSELIKIPTFSAINPCDAYLTALVHDWCKINFYEQYMRNVKNEETGIWEKVPSYRCTGSNLPFGHGVTSMFMAQKFFKLTTEQALAIRWHMSRWNCAEKELVDLCDAEETYPMIHLLQFADQLAAAKY